MKLIEDLEAKEASGAPVSTASRDKLRSAYRELNRFYEQTIFSITSSDAYGGVLSTLQWHQRPAYSPTLKPGG